MGHVTSTQVEKNNVYDDEKISWKDQRSPWLSIRRINPAEQFLFDSNPACSDVRLLVQANLSKSQNWELLLIIPESLNKIMLLAYL